MRPRLRTRHLSSRFVLEVGNTDVGEDIIAEEAGPLIRRTRSRHSGSCEVICETDDEEDQDEVDLGIGSKGATGIDPHIHARLRSDLRMDWYTSACGLIDGQWIC